MILHLQSLGVPVHIDDLADGVRQIETDNDDAESTDPDFPGDGDGDDDSDQFPGEDADEAYLDDENDEE